MSRVWFKSVEWALVSLDVSSTIVPIAIHANYIAFHMAVMGEGMECLSCCYLVTGVQISDNTGNVRIS